MHTRLDLKQIATSINPIVAGWMNYYCQFNRSQLYPFLARINAYLMRWASKKYERLHAFNRFKAWWTAFVDREPCWQIVDQGPTRGPASFPESMYHGH